MIVQADHIVLVWHAWGTTHSAEVMNILPTGPLVSYSGKTVFTSAQGKIIRSLRMWDMAGMLWQMGLLCQSYQKFNTGVWYNSLQLPSQYRARSYRWGQFDRPTYRLAKAIGAVAIAQIATILSV